MHAVGFQETARAESQVIAYNTKRPSTAQSFSSNISDLVPLLLSWVEKADGSPQEVFQAQVCIAWIHWVLNEHELAASRLPQDFGETFDSITSDGQGLSPWTQICLVKGCYIKSE